MASIFCLRFKPDNALCAPLPCQDAELQVREHSLFVSRLWDELFVLFGLKLWLGFTYKRKHLDAISLEGKVWCGQNTPTDSFSVAAVRCPGQLWRTVWVLGTHWLIRDSKTAHLQTRWHRWVGASLGLEAILRGKWWKRAGSAAGPARPVILKH